MISEFKKKLQEDLSKNISKANKSAKSQTDLYFKFYANPNILVNKIISDPSDEFVISLKKNLPNKRHNLNSLLSRKSTNIKLPLTLSSKTSKNS